VFIDNADPLSFCLFFRCEQAPFPLQLRCQGPHYLSPEWLSSEPRRYSTILRTTPRGAAGARIVLTRPSNFGVSTVGQEARGSRLKDFFPFIGPCNVRSPYGPAVSRLSVSAGLRPLARVLSTVLASNTQPPTRRCALLTVISRQQAILEPRSPSSDARIGVVRNARVHASLGL